MKIAPVQLYPNITEQCRAIVAYCFSNLGPQYKFKNMVTSIKYLKQKIKYSYKQGTTKLSVFSSLRQNAITYFRESLVIFIPGFKLCISEFSAKSAIIIYVKLPLLVLDVTFHLLLQSTFIS